MAAENEEGAPSLHGSAPGVSTSLGRRRRPWERPPRSLVDLLD